MPLLQLLSIPKMVTMETASVNLHAKASQLLRRVESILAQDEDADTEAEDDGEENLNEDVGVGHFDGLMQDCSISIALAMEILQPCTKPSTWSYFSIYNLSITFMAFFVLTHWEQMIHILQMMFLNVFSLKEICSILIQILSAFHATEPCE